MWHLLAYNATVDATAGDVKLNAVSDQMFRVNNNNYVMPSNVKLQAAYAGAVAMSRARIVAPHFRVPALPQIVPVNAVLAVPTRAGLLDLRENPLDLIANEEISIEVTTPGGVAIPNLAFLVISDGPLNPAIPNLELRWARFTATPTGVVAAWSARAEITFQDTLQSGIYGVYGLMASGTTQFATRLIFNNLAWRPGIIGAASPDIIPPAPFYKGLGEWGQFENSTPPGIEVLNGTAGAVTINGAMLIGLKQAA